MARLESIDGISKAYVDVTGRHFLLVVKAGAAAEGPTRALAILGKGSRRLNGPLEKAELAAFGKGDLWLEAGNLRRLSLIEARILAENWGKRAAVKARLDAETAGALVILLRTELAREFLRVHKRGGVSKQGWHLRRFPGAFGRAIARLAGGLKPKQAATLRCSLLRSLQS